MDPIIETKPCACGCGEMVLSSGPFKRGHHWRVPRDQWPVDVAEDDQPNEDLQASSLEELATAINREHAAVSEYVTEAMVHAIRAGEILLVVQSRLPGSGYRRGTKPSPGTLDEWLVAHFDASPALAQFYMRVARHKTELEAAGADNLVAAGRALKVIATQAREMRAIARAEEAEQVQELRRQGFSWARIAEHFGVSPSAVRSWVLESGVLGQKGPVQHAKSRQKARERKRVSRRMRMDRVAKERGGSVAHAYAAARKFAQTLEQAIHAEENLIVKDALDRALSRLYSIEDEIVFAGKEKHRLAQNDAKAASRG